MNARHVSPVVLRRNQRGSAYIMVLGAAMIISVIGLSSLLLVRVQSRHTGWSTDVGQARLGALSAIQIGLLQVASDPDWRTTRSSGTWWNDMPIGNGSASLSGIDPIDGDLANDPQDPLVLTATGEHGQSRHMLSVTLDPDPDPSAPAGTMIVRVNSWTQVVQ